MQHQAYLRGGAGTALMPRKAGDRAAKEPRRFKEDEDLGETLAKLAIPEPERARPPRPVAWKRPA